MGATTFTKFPPNSYHAILDNKRVIKGSITFSTSYATGGDTLDLKTVGLSQLDDVLVTTDNLIFAQGGLSIRKGGTPNAPLILAFDTNNTEVANATNLSTRNPVGVWLIGS